MKEFYKHVLEPRVKELLESTGLKDKGFYVLLYEFEALSIRNSENKTVLFFSDSCNGTGFSVGDTHSDDNFCENGALQPSFMRFLYEIEELGKKTR